MCLKLLWFFLDITNLPLAHLNLMVSFTEAILSPVTPNARYVALATQSVWSQNLPGTQRSTPFGGGGENLMGGVDN